MSGIRNNSGSAISRRKRVIKVAPITRAVRMAMAASLAALALGASAGAFAAECKTPTTVMTSCTPAAADMAPVLDLTRVHHAAAPAAFIIPMPISESSVGDVVIDNADPISEVNIYSNATAISGYSSGGSVDITNQATGALEATSLFANGIGIEGYANGNVSIDNAGEIFALSVYENGIGLYGYSMAGDVSINNSGDVEALSFYGLADGVFASGVNVDVGNSGTIEAENVYGGWAAGIEAQGTDLTTVTNDGSISALAVYGTAFGIYTTGDVIEVTNNGDINSQGYTATGIEAQGSSSVTVTNDGDIVAGSITTYYDPYTYSTSVYGTLLATGINATSNYEDGAITINNSGDVSAIGYVGGTGIAATATGTNGSASVSNSGTVFASQYAESGYGAYGIVASADGDATIDNTSTGSITAESAGGATGVAALSFAGSASVTNAGDIVATTTAKYDGAYGIVSFAQNGTAYAGNSGNIDVTTKYIGAGMDVAGLEGATATNSGDITVDAWRSFGIRADSGAGDVAVDNAGSINTTYTGYFSGTAFGIFASSTQGNASVQNSGDIYTTVSDQSVGVFGVSSYGDVDVSNSGTITAYSYGGTAVGVFARADYGTASVDNSGTISAESYTGDAFGVLARGAYADVSNSGDISANGYTSATGIAASSYYGTTVTNTGGSIFAIAVGNAIGIDAQSALGNVDVNNASDLEVVSIAATAKGIQGFAYGNVDINNSGDVYAGSLYSDAIGLYGYSIAGDVSINNSGDITAISYYGLADGIFASGANVDVTNAGSIEVTGYTWAAGIEAQGTATASVTNEGDIYVTGLDQASGFGIYATGDMVAVTNSGSIEVQSYVATGIEAQGGSSVTVTNDGDIVAGSITTYYDPYTYSTSVYGSLLATGINATSNYEDGAITITNNGGVSAVGYLGGTGIAATATGTNGSASVTNNGSVYASQYAGQGYGAYGIVASADGNATIYNTSTGSIMVESAGGATGASALSFAGNASVANAGDIMVNSTAFVGDSAYGIVSFAQNGMADASNTGNIDVATLYIGVGIDAGGLEGATVTSSGDIAVDGYRAFGIRADSGAGDVSVTNEGSINATYSSPYGYAGRAYGIFATSTQGDVSVDNSGDIYTTVGGNSVGVFGNSSYADVGVSNSGTITAYSSGALGVGMFARADNGTVSADNSGTISAESYGDSAYGILARGAYVDANNSGSISATGFYTATGIVARSDYGTTVINSASGEIEASALLVAIGIEARSEYGDVAVTSAGSIMANGAYGGAVGIQAYSGYGDVVAGNSGTIVATSEYGQAIGESGYSLLGNTTVNNSGTIDATGYYGGYGLVAQSGAGTVSVTNSGDITATSPDTAFGILASAYGDVTINNSGNVMAVADGDYANVAAIQMGSLYGVATLNNSGTLSADAPLEGQVAVLGSDGIEVINNTGDIHGSVVLLGGNDIFNNNNGGVWHVDNQSTDFGDGNDSIVNNAGGLIAMSNGTIYMGAGTDSILNLGVISADGDNLIDFGGGSTETLTNVNAISLVDGDTDDSLTIAGNLAGTGSVGIDVDLGALTSDQLYVDGNMTATAAQHVDVLFEGMPLTAHTSIDFAHVTGTSAAGNFVPGQILSYNYPRNFIDLQYSIDSNINAANTAPDVFSINLDVAGLLDSGTLAANAASGAAGMLNAQIGTLRQRLGVNPYGDAGKVMSAFVRFYTNEGDVAPDHVATNFGQGGNFNYDFTTWGREVGVNANLFEGFHAGVTLGSADGRQSLTGAGIGQNRMDGMTWGAYATWFSPNGFYVDLSGRWMAVDVDSTSAAGTLESRVHTGATNLEAGYNWTTASGFVITPQLQYTRTKVDGIQTTFGDRANFEGHGGISSRGRLGVELSKSFQTSAGMSITPYGSINAVREFDGQMDYTVADNFFGNTSTDGTSSMVDVGVGLQNGGWGVTAGANWVDGGAFESVVGGQVVVRFAW